MTNGGQTTNDGRNPDDLSELWQTQTTAKLVPDNIIRRARSQRIKQRFYMLLDVLSLLPVAIYILMDIELPTTLHIFILLAGFLGLITIFYFAKLRWQAMVQSQLETEQYVIMLHQQLINNARIAFLNKHFGWIALLLLTSAFVINSIVTQSSIEEMFGYIARALAYGLVIVIPWSYWAHKREKRFKKEAEQLEMQIQLSER